ncbi:hypothetical protein NNJEOMEG_01372 [Fundidesulfovibrio magnetotacticus]|uniref:HEAT repeat domain-containing protein n=1 Tax=Fundidesulfovibrio magnetotacticus TaxID=2730080 RepID=A0A6V8LT90_9BACT|nr:DVU0298 family protein [Fundidesulfovibrio magnetotacticus]GFK93538.1 hypothetical protein NNJEOMEG_01372 [Fundidesulfovibrio magnetotacticus]
MGKLRALRQTVREALAAEPWPSGLANLETHPPKSLVGPLYAFLLDPDPVLAARAATAFGRTAARLFDQRPEDARQLMRQLMWRLNEESGNIAWGIPETFGEILAAQPDLAREFHRVLASYLIESDRKTGDTYIDHAPLRRGVYAGLAILAKARPELAMAGLEGLLRGLAEEDAPSRAWAALALGRLLPDAGQDAPRITQALDSAARDAASVSLVWGGTLRETTVGQVARECLKNP